MNKRILFISSLIFLISLSLSAQIETRQAGFRMGYRSGIFYQVSQEAGNAEIAYNAMLSFQKNGVQATALKIIYETSIGDISPNLIFSWGYGGHAGFIYSDHVRFLGEDYYFPDDRFCPLLGVDGWVAAEYRITDIPLNVSLNVKPFVELTFPSFLKVTPWDFAVSIAYVF
jgi:hypothetical protein